MASEVYLLWNKEELYSWVRGRENPFPADKIITSFIHLKSMLARLEKASYIICLCELTWDERSAAEMYGIEVVQQLRFRYALTTPVLFTSVLDLAIVKKISMLDICVFELDSVGAEDWFCRINNRCDLANKSINMSGVKDGKYSDALLKYFFKYQDKKEIIFGGSDDGHSDDFFFGKFRTLMLTAQESYTQNINGIIGCNKQFKEHLYQFIPLCQFFIKISCFKDNRFSDDRYKSLTGDQFSEYLSTIKEHFLKKNEKYGQV